MTTVYLCIGMQKTGTTFLQHFMKINKEPLAKQGYCYPDLDVKFPETYYSERNAHFLVHQTEDAETVQEKKKAGYQALGLLAKEYPNIVLSDEIIWYRCIQIENFWEELLREFEEIGCKVKVVAYLRRQDDLIHSLWNQRVKGKAGITEDFKTYLWKKGYTFEQSPEGVRCRFDEKKTLEDRLAYFPLDYYKNLKEIERKIGRENLLVRVFERGQFEGGDHTLLSDYLDTIGVSWNEEFVQENEVQNDGLTDNFVEIKRIINEIPEYRKMKNFLREPMLAACKCQSEQHTDVKTSVFSHDERNAFLQCFVESNQKTAREFLGRDDGILFRKPVSDLPKWEPDTETMYRDIIAYMIEEFCIQEARLTELKEEVRALKKDVKQMSSRFRRIYWKLKDRVTGKNQEQKAN